MALPILDGNQSATTLSSILTSGEHVPAHTVVSLGTQAITDIRGAVSGSVVSISNFPSTQTIAGTVTVGNSLTIQSGNISIEEVFGENSFVPISGTVTVGNSVTIASLPALVAGTAQIGSVTASVTNPVTVGAIVGPNGGSVFKGASGSADAIRALPYFSQNGSVNYNELSTSNPFPIAGSVTIGAGTAQIGSVTASISGTVPISISSVTIGNSVTIGSLPAISGTVTAMAGTNFSDEIYQGILTYANNEGGDGSHPLQVNIGTLPAISGTVTANVSGTIIDPREDYGVATEKLAVQIYGTSGNPIGGLSGEALPIAGTVTVGNSVTISSLPALAAGTAQIGSVTASISNSVTIGSLPLIAGTVTANVGNAVVIQTVGAVQDGDGTTFGIDRDFPISGTVTIGNSVTIASLPAITGTVTANTFALQGTAVTTSNFTSTTASTVLANYSATRQVLTIFNEGAGNLHICAGATCTTIAYQVRLSAGDYYEVPNHQTTITHSAVFATAGTARVTEVS